MHFNQIILTLSISTFTLLVGCGGGSGGNTSNDKPSSTTTKPNDTEILNSNFNQFTTFDWLQDQNTTFVEISNFNNNANILYADYEQLDSKSNKTADRFQLSTDGLYEPDNNQYPLGYRKFFLAHVSQNGNLIRKIPYNLKGLKQHIIEEKGQWINLDNTTISSKTAVYWGILAEKIPDSVFFEVQPFQKHFKSFLKAAKTTKFPSGSKCFKVQEVNYSKKFFVFNNIDTELRTPTLVVKHLDDYIRILGTDAFSGKWGNIQWAYSKAFANDPSYLTLDIYANINNKLANGSWVKNPNTNIQSEIQEYQQQLSDPNLFLSSTDRISYTAAIEEIKNECNYYNPIAAQAIKKLIKEAEIK